jgi:hypothetical protein
MKLYSRHFGSRIAVLSLEPWNHMVAREADHDHSAAGPAIRPAPDAPLSRICPHRDFTLALGIAANVIVFGVLQALILRPLDVPHADRLMTLAQANHPYPIFSCPEVRDVRDGNTVFSAVAAWGVDNFGLEANGVTRPVWGYEVSGQSFEEVGIKPLLGRAEGSKGGNQECGASRPLRSFLLGLGPQTPGRPSGVVARAHTAAGCATREMG